MTLRTHQRPQISSTNLLLAYEQTVIRCTEKNDQDPYPTNFVSDKVIKQSLFFFRFSEGSAHARERRAAKPRDARSEGGSRRTSDKRETAFTLACL